MPFLLSWICTPVLFRISKVSCTVASGTFSFANAHAPATCGVAIDVPLFAANWSLRTDEIMLPPGANKSSIPAELLNDDTESLFVVEPTLIAEEIQAGALIESENPLFPDAITVAIPTDLS